MTDVWFWWLGWLDTNRITNCCSVLITIVNLSYVYTCTCTYIYTCTWYIINYNLFNVRSKFNNGRTKFTMLRQIRWTYFSFYFQLCTYIYIYMYVCALNCLYITDLLEKPTRRALYLGLVDIIFAFAYDNRTTEGEGNVR